MTRCGHHNASHASAAAINSMLQIQTPTFKGSLPDQACEQRGER
jgi:hypothetical protein